jgi:hypothetical protein
MELHFHPLHPRPRVHRLAAGRARGRRRCSVTALPGSATLGGPALLGAALRATALLVTALLGACGGASPHAFVTEPIQGPLRVAILPLANYAPARDAVDRVMPALLVGLGRMRGLEVVDPGRVEEALAQEPWLLMDRIPPDLVGRLGQSLGADALLMGSLLSYGYRESGGERTPQVSFSLRLVQVPSARVLWSAVHSRDGADHEWIFGLGRVESLDLLTTRTVEEILESLPVNADGRAATAEQETGKGK